jgi:hypothetical protein
LEYRVAKTVGETVNDPASVTEALRWMKRPFTLNGQ